MRKAAVLGFAACLAALTPLHATVYVPVGDGPLGTARYSTEVVIANPDAVSRRFIPSFLSTSSGSTQAGSAVVVPAHGTFVLSGFTPAGERGLLAIDGAPRLVVTGRWTASGADGQVLSTVNVPVVNEGALYPAGEALHLQGLARTDSSLSRLGLITLGETPGSCAVAAYGADGSRLGPTVRVEVPALGQSEVEDVLAAAPRGQASEARLEVTCDVPALAWAAVLSEAGVRIAAAVPARPLLAPIARLDSLLGAVRGEGDDSSHRGNPPGTAGGGGGGGNGGGGTNPGNGNPTPPDADGSFSIPGTFFAPRAGDSYKAYDLALRPGVSYQRLTVEYDLFLNRWQSSLFHAVSGLRRADKTLYYGLILRADRGKTVLDLGKGQLAKDNGGLWQEGTDYHLRTTYDVPARRVTLEVFRGNAQIAVIAGAMTSTDLRETNRKVRLDFGIARVADGAYFPPVGWRFSNLKVTAVP